MTSKDIEDFLKALNDTAKSLTCSYCSELCKNPITLGSCFHSVCGEHYDYNLKTCPQCHKELNNCSTFTNEHMINAVDDIKQLQNIFKGYSKENADTTKSTKRKAGKVGESTSKGALLSKSNAESSDRVKTRGDQHKSLECSRTFSASIAGSLAGKSNRTLEKKNSKGETALHTACRQGKLENVSNLLFKGACTNTKDYAGWTPLHEVVQNGRLDLVKLLLQHNALINVPGQSNETPLHEAIRYGFIDIVVELIKNGADVTAWNSKGETPIQLANNNIKEVIENALKSVIIPASNLSIIEDYNDDMYIYCTINDKALSSKLKNLSRNFKIHFEQNITKRLTHMIVDVNKDGICVPSIEIYEAILKGVWILQPSWITDSATTKLEPFENYEVKGIGTIVNNGHKLSKRYKNLQLPGIFNNCHFYLHDFRTKYEISKNVILTKSNLVNLIVEGGGIMLKRTPDPERIPANEELVPYHAKRDGKLKSCSHYIIFKDMFEPMYNMAHLKALHVSWLLECIEKYQLCDP